MKRIGLTVLAFAVAALAMASLPGTADAQLFRKNRTKVVVKNSGPQRVQVRQVQKGRLFGRQSVTEVNVGGQPQRFIRQPARVVVQPQKVVVRQPARVVVGSHAVNVQLIQRQQFRGQLDQLNTYSYVHNAPAAIRFVTAGRVYVQQHQVVTAPVQVQSYTVRTAAPVVVQEYTQPAPVVGTTPCPDGTCQTQGTAPAPAPTAADPNVQYLTQPQPQAVVVQPAPQRVVQRVVTVHRPVAVTQQVYVQTRPSRVRQFIQHSCN